MNIFDAVRAIPAGQTRTYGEIAEATNGHARGVAQALSPLGYTSEIPWWRVVLKSGHIGSEPGTAEHDFVTDQLRAEGVRLSPDGRVIR